MTYLSFLCTQLVVAIETCHLAAAHVVAIGTLCHVMSPIYILGNLTLPCHQNTSAQITCAEEFHRWCIGTFSMFTSPVTGCIWALKADSCETGLTVLLCCLVEQPWPFRYRLLPCLKTTKQLLIHLHGCTPPHPAILENKLWQMFFSPKGGNSWPTPWLTRATLLLLFISTFDLIGQIPFKNIYNNSITSWITFNISLLGKYIYIYVFVLWAQCVSSTYQMV